MTAKEIRAIPIKYDGSNEAHNEEGVRNMLLREVAAQLAELNERNKGFFHGPS